MSLFEDTSSRNGEEEFHFPTEPAFLVSVEVKTCPHLGDGHYGIFAAQKIPTNTKFWAWTDRVNVIPCKDLQTYIANNFKTTEEIQLFLRQGFVLPPSSTSSSEKMDGNGGHEDQYFYSNPTDAGRFMNHSNEPNCGPDGTLRDIQIGEEMTMDYSFHGNPVWYQNICKQYNVQTERQVAEESMKKMNHYSSEASAVDATSC